MATLFNALGLNIKILIAQIVNFLLLAFILYKIGYKPILKFIHDRTAKIEEGVKNAETAARSVQDAQVKQEELLREARDEAGRILTKAKEQADASALVIMEKNKTQLRMIAEKAKRDIHAEREKMIEEVKTEAVTLVVAATEKLLQEKVDAAKDKTIVERLLAQVK